MKEREKKERSGVFAKMKMLLENVMRIISFFNFQNLCITVISVSVVDT